MLNVLVPSYAYSSFVGIFRCSIVHVPSLFPIFYAREREARRFYISFAANYFSFAFSFSSLDLKSCKLSNFYCLFYEKQPTAGLNINAKQHIASLALTYRRFVPQKRQTALALCKPQFSAEQSENLRL